MGKKAKINIDELNSNFFSNLKTGELFKGFVHYIKSVIYFSLALRRVSIICPALSFHVIHGIPSEGM